MVRCVVSVSLAPTSKKIIEAQQRRKMNIDTSKMVAGRTPMFVVEVLYNFFPSDKQHLTLSQYEKVRVIETHESNWWIGERENGEVGLFPANYVRRVVSISLMVGFTSFSTIYHKKVPNQRKRHSKSQLHSIPRRTNKKMRSWKNENN